MTDKNYPLVSICIPTYNGVRFIADALRSAINQTYKNIEIIISDDSSHDNTTGFVKDYLANKSIPHKILYHRHSSIGANWNNCILNATGEYIKFLFQDDVLEHNCIHKMLECFQKYPDVALVGSKRELLIEASSRNDMTTEWVMNHQDLQHTIDTSNEYYFFITKELFTNIQFLIPPHNKIGEPSAVMFKRQITDTIGFFRTDLNQVLDCEYWYRILKQNRICILNEHLAKFRIHECQATNINRQTGERNEMKEYHKIIYKEYRHLLGKRNNKALREKISFLRTMKNFLKPILGYIPGPKPS